MVGNLAYLFFKTVHNNCLYRVIIVFFILSRICDQLPREALQVPWGVWILGAHDILDEDGHSEYHQGQTNDDPVRASALTFINIILY